MYLFRQFVCRSLIIACLAIVCPLEANAAPSWLPAHSSVPSDSISPDGRYGVMLPDAEGDAPNKLVDMKTGAAVANLAGIPGWDGNPSMRFGDMTAKWSADGSTLCWICPGKWFPASYVMLKLRDGHVDWQVELMKPADREILSRTQAAAPLNFAIAKLNNADDGSVYPEGFTIDVSEPPDNFSLPLVCPVSLTSNPKNDADEPGENEVRASLTMTVATDGSLTFSAFKVKGGHLSPDAADKVKAHTVGMPLVDTDLGKTLLFPGLSSKDGRYAVGWTIRAAKKGEPSVDWSHWDPTDPDKVLRLYDWQRYGYMDGVTLPYRALDFVLDNRTGKTANLPTELPNWPGKRDDWEMIARWYSGEQGQQYTLIESDQKNLWIGNFWLVTLSETQMGVKELTAPMRTAVNNLLRDRRPEVAASDYLVTYPLKAGEEAVDKSGLALVPFVANAPSSDQKEFQLSGTVSIRLSDGTVTGVSSDQKRLQPFATNEALKNADETLNTMFQAELKSKSPKDAQMFKKEERDWITQRDQDASQAVNIMLDGLPQEAYEKARENSLLESTKKRIEELERHKA
jgi:uncharacterized protein YecT (DUF1311 family)